MGSELVIYADESDQKGTYFSNFYGGALVRSEHIDEVRAVLAARKRELNLFGEVKWSKVTGNYLQKYADLIDTFFDLVEEDKVKIRVMFTQNANVPQRLTPEQRENAYFRLYYQFIKHAFGLAFCNSTNSPIRLRLYLDRLPDTREKAAQFKSFLAGLQSSTAFRRARLLVPVDQIAEVESHQHDVLQCVDIVLGAMQFRLNDKHKLKPKGAARRGKKTVAKEKLYKHINSRIRKIYPNFNIGVSTGTGGNKTNRWLHPYRHWVFSSAEVEWDESRTKRHGRAK